MPRTSSTPEGSWTPTKPCGSAWWTRSYRTLTCTARQPGSPGSSCPVPRWPCAAKEAIDTGLDLDLDAGLEVERLHFAALFATEDQKLGMESFVASGPGQAKFAGK